MAVTGVFTADFSSFDKAVQTSTKNLEGLESGAEKTNSSLRLMSQTQEQMLDKIGASGGKIQEVGAAVKATGGEVNTLTSSYKQFDGILQAAGINIGPQVKGLEDLANMAGKTAAQLGVIGSAGAIAGAAMTGWNFGQLIADWTDLDEKLGDVLLKWLQLPHVLTDGERHQTVMNQAVALGAKNIHSLADAQKFLKEENQKVADSQINWTEKLADSYRELRNLTDAQKAGIAIMQEAHATIPQITDKYHIHALTLDLLKQETDKAADAQAKLTAEHTKAAAEAEKLEAAYAKLMSDTKNLNQQALMDADAAKLKIENDQKRWESTIKVRDAILASAKASNEAAVFEKAYVAEQANVEQSNEELIASFGGMTEAHVEAGAAAAAGTAQTVAGYQQVAQQVEITSDGVRGWLELMRATNAANALLNQNSLFTSSSTLENQSRIGTAFSPIPGFASGIENFGGGLAKVHGGEVLANLPAGTSVFPKGSGFGTTISNVFNLVDSESNLARRVSELIMRQIRAGTQLGTA